MRQDSSIRLRPDGSIDTAYYMAIGRRMRSEQAHQLVKTLAPKKRQPKAKHSLGVFRIRLQRT